MARSACGTGLRSGERVMGMLVVGTFEAEKQAAQAVRKLLRSCVPSEHVRTLAPALRRRISGAIRNGKGRLRDKQSGGILVAVNAADNVSQVLAVKVLREHGARDIEQTSAAAPRSTTAKRARHGLPSIQYPLPL